MDGFITENAALFFGITIIYFISTFINICVKIYFHYRRKSALERLFKRKISHQECRNVDVTDMLYFAEIHAALEYINERSISVKEIANLKQLNSVNSTAEILAVLEMIQKNTFNEFYEEYKASSETLSKALKK